MIIVKMVHILLLIVDSQMMLNEYGNITKKHIEDISLKWDNVFVPKYVIMPNHIHMILEIECVQNRQEQKVSVQHIIGAMKSLITMEILSIYKANNKYMGKIFQRSYYDHIIRNEAEYNKIWEYIDTNPLKWELDKYYI